MENSLPPLGIMAARMSMKAYTEKRTADIERKRNRVLILKKIARRIVLFVPPFIFLAFFPSHCVFFPPFDSGLI